MTTIQLTLITALKVIMLNVSTWDSINLHIIDAAEAEFASVPAFEELSFMGLNVLKDLKDNTEIQNPHTLQCCIIYIKIRQTISIITWRGLYHAYVDTKFYKTSDLTAAFHSEFLIDEQANWYPTIKYLIYILHSTLFTATKYFEIQENMRVWKNLRAEFVKNTEVNK